MCRRCAPWRHQYCRRSRALGRRRSKRCATRRDFLLTTKMRVSCPASGTLEASRRGGSGEGLSAPIMHWVTWAFRNPTMRWYSSTPIFPFGKMRILASWRQLSRLATRFSSALDEKGRTSRIKPRRVAGFKTVSFWRIGGRYDGRYHPGRALAQRQIGMPKERRSVLLRNLGIFTI